MTETKEPNEFKEAKLKHCRNNKGIRKKSGYRVCRNRSSVWVPALSLQYPLISWIDIVVSHLPRSI